MRRSFWHTSAAVIAAGWMLNVAGASAAQQLPLGQDYDFGTPREFRIDPDAREFALRPLMEVEGKEYSVSVFGHRFEYEEYESVPHETFNFNYEGVYTDFPLNEDSSLRLSFGHAESSFELLPSADEFTTLVRWRRRF